MIARDGTLPGATEARNRWIPCSLAAQSNRPRTTRMGRQRSGGDALPPILRLDAIAHLDSAVGVGRAVEADRADEPACAVRLGQDDRPTQPRLCRRIELQVDDPVLQEVVELPGQCVRDADAELLRGTVEVAGEEQDHEAQGHRDELEPGGADRRHIHPHIVAQRIT